MYWVTVGGAGFPSQLQITLLGGLDLDDLDTLFSKFATCAEVPDVYHGWTFYIGDQKDFMPDFTSRD